MAAYESIALLSSFFTRLSSAPLHQLLLIHDTLQTIIDEEFEDDDIYDF